MDDISPNARMIDIALIRPNPYNPNSMSKRELRELAVEMKHLGQLPHPLIVRLIAEASNGKQYEIIDGEHRYLAAMELNLKEVPCVVQDVDDFEAMRQTYKRNQGGRNNKVKLGHMYCAMRQASGLSRRRLATTISIPEATIRVAEEYARAAETRTACAPDTADADIAGLKYGQVSKYLELRSELRDRWLEAGADVSAFDTRSGIMPEVLADLFVEFGLVPFLEPGTKFRESVRRLTPHVIWLERHRNIAEVKDYARAVAECGLSANVCDALPLRQHDGGFGVAIPLPLWRSALETLQATSFTAAAEVIGARSAVRIALQDGGADLSSILGPAEAESIAIVSQAPPFIQRADKYLTLKQQRWLAEADAQLTGDNKKQSERAKQHACRDIQQKGRCTDVELAAVYRQHLQRLPEPTRPAPKPIADGELRAVISDRLASNSRVWSELIDGRRAADCLAERLASVPEPERRLFTAALMVETGMEDAVLRWIADLREKMEFECAPEA